VHSHLWTPARLSCIIVLIAILAVAACSDNTLAPFQPEISNVVDTFQLQATGVTNRTATLNYNWSNTGTLASVNHSTTTTAGSARVVIHDGAGTLVYNEILVPSLNEPTLVGVAGTWTVQLVLDGYSGTLNFRVQKTT
jgi:multisubunit Na+/H+ antiporter MnhB subunit